MMTINLNLNIHETTQMSSSSSIIEVAITKNSECGKYDTDTA